jgi:hypothetical protein
VFREHALFLPNVTRDSDEVAALMSLAFDTLNEVLKESACFDGDNCVIRFIDFVDELMKD